MDVAILSFHTRLIDSDMSGVSTSAIYVRDLLEDTPGVTSQIYSFYNAEEFIDDSIKYIDPENYHELNDYDYMIFITPGTTNSTRVSDKKLYDKLLSTISIPYSIMIHDEFYIKLYPHEELFRSTDYCVGYLLVDSLMRDRFDFLDPDRYVIDVTMMIPKMSPWSEVHDKILSKSGNVLASTSRVTTHKRQFELLSNYTDLVSKGLSVRCYGSLSAHWTYYKIEAELGNTLPLGEILQGVYYPQELEDILNGITYHYNLCYYKVGHSNKSVGKRLELTTLEALNEGCVPIISEEMRPEDLPDNSAIVIDKFSESDLVDVLPMSTESRVEYCSNMYDYVSRLRCHTVEVMHSHVVECYSNYYKEVSSEDSSI